MVTHSVQRGIDGGSQYTVRGIDGGSRCTGRGIQRRGNQLMCRVKNFGLLTIWTSEAGIPAQLIQQMAQDGGIARAWIEDPKVYPGIPMAQ